MKLSANQLDAARSLLKRIEAQARWSLFNEIAGGACMTLGFAVLISSALGWKEPSYPLAALIFLVGAVSFRRGRDGRLFKESSAVLKAGIAATGSDSA